MTQPARQTEPLNRLLAGECSALATYEGAIKCVRDSVLKKLLQEVKEEHEKRARLLCQHIERLGGIPSSSAGCWCNFSSVLGLPSLLAQLKQGEERLLDEYRHSVGRAPGGCEREVPRLLDDQAEAARLLEKMAREVYRMHKVVYPYR